MNNLLTVRKDMEGLDSFCLMGMSLALNESKPVTTTTTYSKHRNLKNRKVDKMYTITGQAPSPSKDFFELIVAKDRVIWRAWRIKYKNHKKITPTEERLTYDEFENDGKIHREVASSLGEDVLHTALGYTSKEWLARLPRGLLVKIFQMLEVNDLCILAKVGASAF